MASSNGNDKGGVWDKNTPLRYVTQVMRKLDDGTYPTEATKCFCGIEPANDSVLTERDRYTIPHRMVMCEHCLLMRANPRMTKEAYEQFYNNEYRKIYDGFPYQEKSEDDDFLFGIAYERAKSLKDFLRQCECDPKIIVDIGSDKSATLMPFKEGGAEVYGIEICAEGRASAATKGIQSFATIEEAAVRGIKADLIIMQDMIEHLTDLREMEKLPTILAPKGYIFIYTPGLLAIDPQQAFQNAHTFQFIAASLEYVMNQMGYIAEFLDDRVVSLWRYDTNLIASPLPIEWRKFIVEHIEKPERRALPPVRTRCKFTEKEMMTNIEANLKLKLPDIFSLKNKYSGPVVVVGGGPSVDGQIDKIRELIKAGAKLVVIERMYPWCSEHGLKPDFVVALDASDDVTDGFTHIQPGVKHLIVATIKPSIFECLKDQEVYVWSGVGGSFIDAQEHWSKNGYNHVMIVNTGSTVVLASITLSLIFGFRNVHLFGLDCMVPNTTDTYAKGIAGTSVDRTYMEVEVGENREVVLTCAAFLAFAQQFFGIIETARKQGMIDSIDIYGESLINKMWDGDLTVVATEAKEVCTYVQ